MSRSPFIAAVGDRVVRTVLDEVTLLPTAITHISRRRRTSLWFSIRPNLRKWTRTTSAPTSCSWMSLKVRALPLIARGGHHLLDLREEWKNETESRHFQHTQLDSSEPGGTKRTVVLEVSTRHMMCAVGVALRTL